MNIALNKNVEKILRQEVTFKTGFFFGVLPATKGSRVAGKLSFQQIFVEFLVKIVEFWCKNIEFWEEMSQIKVFMENYLLKYTCK